MNSNLVTSRSLAFRHISLFYSLFFEVFVHTNEVNDDIYICDAVVSIDDLLTLGYYEAGRKSF